MVDSLRSDLGHTIAKRARLAIKPSQMHQGALFEVRGSAQPRASAPAANSLSCPSGELQTIPTSRFVRCATLPVYHCPPRTAAVLNKLSSSSHASPHECSNTTPLRPAKLMNGDYVVSFSMRKVMDSRCESLGRSSFGIECCVLCGGKEKEKHHGGAR